MSGLYTGAGGYSQYAGDQNVLYTPLEYAQARKRPFPDRVPLPKEGDELLYRHVEGSPLLYRIRVLAVESLENLSDGNLWYFQTDQYGQPATLEGDQILAQAHDPWPMIRFELLDEVNERGWLPAGAQGDTREARMRGSCGWLPLDWETRPQPAPPSFALLYADGTLITDRGVSRE